MTYPIVYKVVLVSIIPIVIAVVMQDILVSIKKLHYGKKFSRLMLENYMSEHLGKCSEVSIFSLKIEVQIFLFRSTLANNSIILTTFTIFMPKCNSLFT